MYSTDDVTRLWSVCHNIFYAICATLFCCCCTHPLSMSKHQNAKSKHMFIAQGRSLDTGVTIFESSNVHRIFLLHSIELPVVH